MDDEREREMRRSEEPLDYSPSSGATDVADVMKDQSRDNFHVTEDKTDWSDSDAPFETIERFGVVKNKWKWLNRLNKSTNAEFRREENRNLARIKDIRQLLDILEFEHEQDKEWVFDESQTIIQRLSNSEKGFQFGGGSLIETAEIAIVTLTSRKLASKEIDDINELNDDKTLHSLSIDGTSVEKLCKIWVGKDVTVNDVRNRRTEIRKRISV